MSFSVEDFKARLVYGGARPNLFRVRISPIAGIDDVDGIDEKIAYLAKSTSLPASTIAEIPVAFRGRQIKVAGDRTFADWTVTFINDNDFAIRNYFEKWMHLNMNTHETNVGPLIMSEYKADMEVDQLNKTGEVSKTYKFYGAFPTEVAAIDLSYDSDNQIEEFSVTFSYDYWLDANKAGSTAE